MNENVNNEEIEKNSVSSDNSQELFDLIESIQSKLNFENNTKNINIDNKNNSLEENEKINISHENFENNIDNNSKNIDNNKINNLDFSNITSLLQNIDLSALLNMFSSNNNNSDTYTNQDFSNNSIFSELKPSTILKFQRVITSMNKSDPKKNLLLSLKPFLRKSRQDKINEYITMLTIANAIEIFGSKGSDE